MTHRHRHPRTPHPFVADRTVRAVSEALIPCERCGMYRFHAIHTEYDEPEGDRSAEILGEHERGVSDDAA